MSILNKTWQILNTDQKLSTLEKLYLNRSYFPDNEMINLIDPFLFSQMARAVQRIETAIQENQRIIVFGDYDVDGISGTALLYQTLKKLGAQVSYRIPHREKDGYGLTMPFIPEFKEKKINLVITVDCGISCEKEVAEANNQGIDIIITDHHQIPSVLPPAYAIIHPKLDNNYPYRELTGSGVAFKLAHALLAHFKIDFLESEIENLVDLASLGTVADMGPLTGENRLIVKRGLSRLKETKWPGLRQLMETAAIDLEQDLDTYHIGFGIGPRINAAGRIGNPYVALQLLLQENDSEKILELSKELENLNTKRIELTKQAIEEAQEQIDFEKLPPIIILQSNNWHVGILGLIASRLSEIHHRPVIIFTDK